MIKRKKINPFYELQPAQELPELMATKPMPEMAKANETTEIQAPHESLKLAENTRVGTKETLLPNEEYSGVGGA